MRMQLKRTLPKASDCLHKSTMRIQMKKINKGQIKNKEKGRSRENRTAGKTQAAQASAQRMEDVHTKSKLPHILEHVQMAQRHLNSTHDHMLIHSQLMILRIGKTMRISLQPWSLIPARMNFNSIQNVPAELFHNSEIVATERGPRVLDGTGQSTKPSQSVGHLPKPCKHR